MPKWRVYMERPEEIAMKRVQVADFWIGENAPFTVISGPCVIEHEELALAAAWHLKELFSRLGIQFIYKSSYDKANRLSLSSFRGVGLKEGLRILARVRDEVGVPVLTDVHTSEEATRAGEVCDVLQIPALLCRQTDLTLAAAATGRVVNIKKGQFMAPWDMKNIVAKVVNSGSDNLFITERGTSFGYNNLVSDMRSIPLLQEMGFPVCYDASHSVQIPGGQGASSGGDRRFIPTLASAAVAAGCNLIFLESHPNPAQAKSDSASVYPFDQMESLMTRLLRLHEAVRISAMCGCET